MIEALTIFALVILFGFLIILPIYVGLFKEDIYMYIKNRMDIEAQIEKNRKKWKK